MSYNRDFGTLDLGDVREFINLYHEDNMILEKGDLCYCMIQNVQDYHMPLIAKGEIIDDVYGEGLSKNYFIQIHRLIDSPEILNEFFIGNVFQVYRYNGRIGKQKNWQVTPKFNLNNKLFKVNCFFTRGAKLNEFDDTKIHNQMINFRSDYLSFIKKDIEKQLDDINKLM